jgi:hypothetical protein
MDIFLYSLAEFRPLIFECLEIAGTRSVIEVGSELGLFTKELASWANQRGGTVTCIEPAPTEEVRNTCAQSPGLKLVEGRSPAALNDIPTADVYLLDGDHNYFTLKGELDTLNDRLSGKAGYSLAILHDVCWPWARRDLYYNPSALPAEALHPYSMDDGVTLDNPGVIQGGFRSMGAYAVARQEGGPKNGLLTAVEDYLKGRDDLVFVMVPCISGLGFIFSKKAPYAEKLQAHLRGYDRNWLLQKLERNRLELFLKLIEMYDGSLASEAAQRAEKERLEKRIAELEAEVAQKARAA